MKILVCVKLVPDFDINETVVIDEKMTRVRTDEGTAFRINRFDEFAVEEALLMRDKQPEMTIDAITAGPPSFEAAVRRALGMGVNQGIHLVTGDKSYASPFQISQWIAAVAVEKGYDLVLTGVMSEDAMQGQVGPLIAERLSLPCATAVVATRLAEDGSRMEVEREIEGGYRDILSLDLPALLTVQSGINQPRYPSLSNVLRAKKAILETIPVETLPSGDVRQHLLALSYPRKTRAALVLNGSLGEKAHQLYQLLRDKALIH